MTAAILTVYTIQCTFLKTLLRHILDCNTMRKNCLCKKYFNERFKTSKHEEQGSKLEQEDFTSAAKETLTSDWHADGHVTESFYLRVENRPNNRVAPRVQLKFKLGNFTDSQTLPRASLHPRTHTYPRMHTSSCSRHRSTSCTKKDTGQVI